MLFRLKKSRSLLTVAAMLLLAAAAPLRAQAPQAGEARGAGDHADAPVAVATRTSLPIRVDGRLEDAAWAAAEPITTFTQVVPHEGEPASERTEIRILYDDEAIYVGARLYDRHPVTTRLGRRDMPMTASDWLTVLFDSYHDHRSAFGFEVNPSGVRRDQARAGGAEDDSWDPVWEAATSIDAEGWTAELRIPFSQLRFSPAEAQVWGVQFERTIARNAEFSVFSFTPTTQPGGIPRYGHLHGLSGLQTGRRVELLPYSVARGEFVDRSGNPFRTDREGRLSVGLDAKYRLTSDVTLDATLNPDFGQVEVDPAQVNLSAIETFFQEKRPFFVESAEIFQFGAGGGNNVFYSRRIGRAPQLGVGGAADMPEAAGILGAGKLSGRTAGGWAIGVLEALTGSAEARVRDPGGTDHTVVVEPLTNYFVARARRESQAGRSVIGGMMTAVNRSLDSDPLRAQLPSSAYSGGFDFTRENAARTWVLSGFVSGSHVRGDSMAMDVRQRAPWRYYQRPDARHLGLDAGRESLTGGALQVQLQRRRGRHWRASALVGTITPGYDVNDIGFQYRADRVDGQLSVTFVEPRPGRVMRNWQVTSTARNEMNYARQTILRQVGGTVQGLHLSYWNAFLSGNWQFPSFDDRLTRGGPLAERPRMTRIGTGFGSDPRRPLGVGVQLQFNRDAAGGGTDAITVISLYKPTPKWDLGVAPQLVRGRSGAQFVGSIADPRATSTFGRRYLFTPLDQTTLSLETRVNYTFNPRLSLQFYAQPYISSADFGAPGELRAPGTYEFLVYGRDIGNIEQIPGGYAVDPAGVGQGGSFGLPNRDFNLRSLRGNAVVRWEWRAGSTLFLAWQQSREDFAPLTGDFDFTRDRAALLRAPSDNVFLVKLNYWWNP